MLVHDMLILVSIAAGVMILNLVVQLSLIAVSTNYLVKVTKRGRLGFNQLRDAIIMGVILLYILLAHLIQMATWAVAFMWIGEFDRFQDAFYHSAVNFASLGYGDVVMSEDWRLLGALEAAIGVMMFGVSAALLFAILSKVIRNRFEALTHHDPKS